MSNWRSAIMSDPIRLCTVTFLVFFTTTTGTWVVSPHFFSLMYSIRPGGRYAAIKLHPLRPHNLHGIQYRRAHLLGLLRLGRFLWLSLQVLRELVLLVLLGLLGLMMLMMLMRRLLLPDKLDLEHPFNRICLYSVNHVIKHVKTFTLIFNQGIFLAVASKPDSFFKMVHGKEVVLPKGIHNLEEDYLFYLSHDLTGKSSFFISIFLA